VVGVDLQQQHPPGRTAWLTIMGLGSARDSTLWVYRPGMRSHQALYSGPLTDVDFGLRRRPKLPQPPVPTTF
jgi:hypothetical protein